MSHKIIPILRIFDVNKALDFYVNWLGFKVDWQHKFEERSPLYMQVSFQHIFLHLTEHHGDCVPGARVYIEFTGVKEYHRILINKDYIYNRPGCDQECMEVID